MIRRTLASLAVAAVAFGAFSFSAPATAEVASAPVAKAAASAEVAPAAVEVGALAACPFAPPQDGYLHVFNSFHCDDALGNIGESGRYNNCYNLTIHGTPPNGWSNLMSSGYNTMSVAVGFYDAFNCDGPVLFAMNAGTIRATLVTAANNKASSYRVTLFPIWTS